MHGEGQALALRKRAAFFHRSAGACPPRVPSSREGVLGPLGPKDSFFIVARGPVPRDRCMARDRPSPYGEGVAFFTVARGPVPRDRWIARTMARDRFSHRPTMKGTVFYRSAGACPPRSMHGEGNPLACAGGMRGPKPCDEGAAFFHRDVERIMKSPLIIRREIHL